MTEPLRHKTIQTCPVCKGNGVTRRKKDAATVPCRRCRGKGWVKI